MPVTSNKYLNKMRNCFMLLGIYLMHLVCFQALMAAPVTSTESSKVFKPLFISNQKKINHRPHSHPAVTFSAFLFKQSLVEVRTAIQSPAIIVSDLEDLVPQTHISSVIPYQSSLAISHIADDTYKRYRLLGVFLI
jgi:hypothetical protein